MNRVKQAFYGESEQGYQMTYASPGISQETREFMKKNIYLMPGDGEEEVEEIRYFYRKETKEYLLMFLTYLKEETSFDKRNQMFAHCFVLNKRQAETLFRYPENVFLFPHLSSPEMIQVDNPEIEVDWEMFGQNIEENETITDEVVKQYTYCISRNQYGKMNVQINHLFSDFKRGDWKRIYAAILRKLPLEKRVELSFSMNPRDHQECGMCEINFLDRDAYYELMKGRTQGKRVLDRIVLEDRSVLTSCVEEKETKGIKNPYGRRPHTKPDKRKRRKHARYNWKVILSGMIFFLLSVFILSRFWMFGYVVPGRITLYLSVSNDVFVFLAQIVAAVLATNLRVEWKKHKKRRGNRERVISDYYDCNDSCSPERNQMEKGDAD